MQKALCYIFGYGSLISAESCSRTLTYRLLQNHLLPCRLKGFRREWTYYYKWEKGTFLYPNGEPYNGYLTYLNIARDPNNAVNGVLVPVFREEDLQNLDKREKNYERIDVKRQMDIHVDKPIETYLADCDESELKGYENYIAQYYIDTVQKGCMSISKAFWDEFQQTTVKSSIPVLDLKRRMI